MRTYHIPGSKIILTVSGFWKIWPIIKIISKNNEINIEMNIEINNW